MSVAVLDVDREGIDVLIDPHAYDFVDDKPAASRMIRGINSPNFMREAGDLLRLVHVPTRWITLPPNGFGISTTRRGAIRSTCTGWRERRG
jgi:hypothetical protein